MALYTQVSMMDSARRALVFGLVLLSLAACGRGGKSSNSGDPNALDYVPSTALLADLNGDGRLDIVVVGDGGKSVFLGDPVEGIVAAPQLLPAFKANVKGLAAGDLVRETGTPGQPPPPVKPELVLAVRCDKLEQPEEGQAKDAYVDSVNKQNKYGTFFEISRGSPTAANPTTTGEALIQVNEGLVPQGRILDHAVLSLFHMGVAYPAPAGAELVLYKNPQDWDEALVDWDTRPSQSPRSSPVSTLAVPAGNRLARREFEITDPYRSWGAFPAQNFGLTLSRRDATGLDIPVSTVIPSSNWLASGSGMPNALSPALLPKLLLWYHEQGRPARDLFRPPLMIQNAAGGFEKSPTQPETWFGDWIAVLAADFDDRDMDQDPKTGADIFLVSEFGGHQLLSNDAASSGAFELPIVLQPVATPTAGALAADLDKDGLADVVLHDGTGGIRVWRGQASGMFDEPADVDAQGNRSNKDNKPGSVRAGQGQEDGEIVLLDADQDDKLDIVVSSGPGDSLTLLRNKGGGQFEDLGAGFAGFTGIEARALAAADLDGDLDLDLVYAKAAFPFGLGYLRNLGSGVFAPITPAPFGFEDVSGLIVDIEVGDIDGDGKLDLVVVLGGGAPGFNVQFGQ